MKWRSSRRLTYLSWVLFETSRAQHRTQQESITKPSKEEEKEDDDENNNNKKSGIRMNKRSQMRVSNAHILTVNRIIMIIVMVIPKSSTKSKRCVAMRWSTRIKSTSYDYCVCVCLFVSSALHTHHTHEKICGECEQKQTITKSMQYLWLTLNDFNVTL